MPSAESFTFQSPGHARAPAATARGCGWEGGLYGSAGGESGGCGRPGDLCPTAENAPPHTTLGLGPVSVRPPQLLPAQKLVLQVPVGIPSPAISSSPFPTPRKVSAQPHLGSATSHVRHAPIWPHAASASSRFLTYSCVAIGFRATNVSTGCSMYHSAGPH